MLLLLLLVCYSLASQDSTRLWELLPASTMDSAIDLHHACLRTCSAAHGGYEALTEGDSFTLAFHTPHAALAFCLAAQEALMLQDWPPELLEVSVPRWCSGARLLARCSAVGQRAYKLMSPHLWVRCGTCVQY